MNELGRFMTDNLTTVSCVAESTEHTMSFYFISPLIPSVVLVLKITKTFACHTLMLVQLSPGWR